MAISVDIGAKIPIDGKRGDLAAVYQEEIRNNYSEVGMKAITNFDANAPHFHKIYSWLKN